MSAAEMAAESGAHGDSVDTTSSNGYASDARDQELSNGTSAGAITPLQTAQSGDEAGALRSLHRVRSETEQKLIARGRYLLHAYQKKKREKQETLDEMCFSPTSELSAVEVLDKNGYYHQDRHILSNGHSAGEAAAAAASMDSDENWLAPSVYEHKPLKHEQLLDAMEKQLEELWSALGDDAVYESVVASSRQSLSELLRQKRIADAEWASERSKSDVVSVDHDKIANGFTRTDSDASARTAQDLEAELADARVLINELNDKVNAYRAQLLTFSSKAHRPPRDSHDAYSHSVGGEDAEVQKLQNCLQEKEELLLSLRSSLEHVVQDHGKLDKELRKAQALVEQLQGEKEQMQKAASDKRTLLHRAYIVKAKQLDQLCKNIELPSTWERVTDEIGIIYYRQNDRACAPELEDPRVTLAMQKSHFASPGSSSPRSASGRMEQAAHAARSSDRKYSSSSFDSTISCEDIAIPPEDGTKHEVEDFETPLPEGWEMRVTTAGSVFFVNRNTNVTTWKDPRRMKGKKLMVKRSSAPYGSLSSTTSSTEVPERRASIGAPPQSGLSTPASEPSDTEIFDVVFEEKGPIGIHFKANTPDAGAMVCRLLPRMAASRSKKIEPFDRLIAVNKNPVDNAPFRYVMLLLQGGLRPLTLTFERSAHPQDSEPRNNAVPQELLDEEVVLAGATDQSSVRTPNEDGGDDASHHDTVDDSLQHRHRHSTGSSYSSVSEVESSSTGHHEEDFSIADKIITNVFSLFWTPPDQPRGQVETV